MKSLRVFRSIVTLLGGGVMFMLIHGFWVGVAHVPNTQFRSLISLGGNPFENNTLYFRHFEISDYMSGHFYYPGSPLLGHESYTYRVKHYEP